MTTQTQKPTQAMAAPQPRPSERFTNLVMAEFTGVVGQQIELTASQKRLAQHLFIKIDASLKVAEEKRLQKSDARPEDSKAITWQHVNMNKLALDAMHRIDLGLDALIPNHISPIPYWNTKEQKYDLDLRVGYVGKDYYRRHMATEEPLDVIYELVYSKDTFKPIKHGKDSPIDTYDFQITAPFDRGEIVGGFGYIMYEDSRKNKLVVVTEKDFEKYHKLAKSEEFWSKWPVEMRLKTLVHRVTDKIVIDPTKVNESYAAVEEQDSELEIKTEIAEHANAEVIDVSTGEITEVKQIEPEKQQKAEAPF